MSAGYWLEDSDIGLIRNTIVDNDIADLDSLLSSIDRQTALSLPQAPDNLKRLQRCLDRFNRNPDKSYLTKLVNMAKSFVTDTAANKKLFDTIEALLKTAVFKTSPVKRKATRKKPQKKDDPDLIKEELTALFKKVVDFSKNVNFRQAVICKSLGKNVYLLACVTNDPDQTSAPPLLSVNEDPAHVFVTLRDISGTKRHKVVNVTLEMKNNFLKWNPTSKPDETIQVAEFDLSQGGRISALSYNTERTLTGGAVIRCSASMTKTMRSGDMEVAVMV